MIGFGGRGVYGSEEEKSVVVESLYVRWKKGVSAFVEIVC